MKYFSSGPFTIQKVHPSKSVKMKGGVTQRLIAAQKLNAVTSDSESVSLAMRGMAAGTGGGEFSKEAFE